MPNDVRRIPLDKLIEHPENPNRMSGQTFGKLVRHIERTGRYEPLVVRKVADGDRFEIINGHHRARALKRLGHDYADAVVWQLDDDEARLYLATLNRLCGTDDFDKRGKLLAALAEKFSNAQLGKLLPESRKAVERLTNLNPPQPSDPGDVGTLPVSLVFFVDAEQKAVIDKALDAADVELARTPEKYHDDEKKLRCPGGRDKPTNAQKKARALEALAQWFLQTRE